MKRKIDRMKLGLFIGLLLLSISPGLGAQNRLYRQDHRLGPGNERVSHGLMIGETGILDVKGLSLDFPFTIDLAGPGGIRSTAYSQNRFAQLFVPVTLPGSYTLVMEVPPEGKAGTLSVLVDLVAFAGNLAIQPSIQGDLGQNSTEIEPNKYIDWYEYTIPESGRAMIRLASEEFDTFLIVTYSDGTEDVNDDFDGTNSALRISGFPGDRVMVGATSYSPFSMGRYTISALAAQPPRPVSLGQPARGSFGSGVEDDYFFTAPETGRYIFELFSSGYEDMLILIDQNGEEFFARTSGSFGPVISRRLNEGEQVMLSPQSFDPGAYRLLVALAEEGQDLVLGSPVYGFLDRGEYQDYVFRGDSQPGLLVIDLQSDEFDTYLELLTSRGELIEDDDSYEGELDYQSLIRYMPDPDEELVITVRGYSPSDTGTFILRVDRTDLPEGLAVYEPNQLLQVNSTYDYIMSGSNHQFRVELTRGQRIIITMDSRDFDSYLELDGPGGYWSDDDGGEGLNARIDMVVPSSGLYTLIARSFGGSGSAGTYRLGIFEGN